VSYVWYIYLLLCGVYMVSSPFHVYGYGLHLRWSYNLCYMGVDVDADASGDA